MTNFPFANKPRSFLPVVVCSFALTACGGGGDGDSAGGGSSSSAGYTWPASPENLQIEMTVQSATGTGTNVGQIILFMKPSSSDPSGYAPAGFNTRDKKVFDADDFDSYNWQRSGGSNYKIVLDYAGSQVVDTFVLTPKSAGAGTYTASNYSGGSSGTYKIIGMPLSDGPRITPGSDNQVAAFPDKLDKDQILNNQFAEGTTIEWLFDKQAGDPEFYMYSASGAGASENGLYLGRVNAAGERVDQVRVSDIDLSDANVNRSIWSSAVQKPYSGVEGAQRIRYDGVSDGYTLTTGGVKVYAADASGFQLASSSYDNGAIGRKSVSHLTADLIFNAAKGKLTLKDGAGTEICSARLGNLNDMRYMPLNYSGSNWWERVASAKDDGTVILGDDGFIYAFSFSGNAGVISKMNQTCGVQWTRQIGVLRDANEIVASSLFRKVGDQLYFSVHDNILLNAERMSRYSVYRVDTGSGNVEALIDKRWRYAEDVRADIYDVAIDAQGRLLVVTASALQRRDPDTFEILWSVDVEGADGFPDSIQSGQKSLAPLTAWDDGAVEVASMYVFSAAKLASLDKKIRR
ncbi:hypothetical protein [uncultured Marinobacter sp.]|uniref:hypothetical protein n=1 Tax=uncultured Marinobacter sp. TaxID=187379 RepID=UPI00262870A1|nr:hypothetical protein [uncultured Marinobacter sp.]